MSILRYLLTVAVAFTLSAFLSAQNVNYDEAAVAPYELQDPLVFSNGKKVSKRQWPQRRQEILELFQHEM